MASVLKTMLVLHQGDCIDREFIEFDIPDSIEA